MQRAPGTLVVGGGIGGLTVASALFRRGVDVRVVEQAKHFEPVGAGITIQANAAAVLRALGIELPGADVLPIGGVEVLGERGRTLMRANAAEILQDPPSVTIHRADLHRALLSACKDVPLEAGVRVASVLPDAQGVDVVFDDARRERFGWVIGADGIRSALRQALTGESDADLRYSGQTCWRFAVEAPDLVPRIPTERWMPGRRIGMVPIAGGRVYVYLVESAARGTPGPGTSTPDTLRARFGGVDPRLDGLLERLNGSVPIDHSDLLDRTRISFGAGRVVLIGDAAHPMTPNLGQGACMAIEDVGALALLLREHAADPSTLPQAIDALRRSRVASVQRASWRIGQVSHWSNPVACSLRNALLRVTPDSASSRQARQLWQPGVELAAQLRASAPFL